MMAVKIPDVGGRLIHHGEGRGQTRKADESDRNAAMKGTALPSGRAVMRQCL